MDELQTIKEVFVRFKPTEIDSSDFPYNASVKTPNAIAHITASLLDGVDEECFLVYNLSSANKIISFMTAGLGGVNRCSISISKVFRSAICQGAAAIIVAHNHPSGPCNPSPEDIALTRRLVSAGKLLDISVLDHVIVGTEHTSLRKQQPELF